LRISSVVCENLTGGVDMMIWLKNKYRGGDETDNIDEYENFLHDVDESKHC